MKLTTTAGKLRAIVSSVTSIIARANTLPILGNVLIKCEADSVAVTGTDLEITVRTRSDIKALEPGTSTIHAGKLVALLAALASEDVVTLTVSELDGGAILKAGKSRFSLRTLPPEDYPSTGGSKGKAIGGTILPVVDLKEALERVTPFMAVNDIRYYLNGLFIDPVSDGICLVATDGHRLSKVKVPYEGDTRLSRGVIIPGKTAKLVLKLLPKSGVITVVEYEGIVTFDMGDTTIDSKTIAATFPDYNRVLPNYESATTVDRLQLLQALQRCKILCNDRVRAVSMFPHASMGAAGGRLVISSKNDSQEESEDEVEAEVPASAASSTGFNVDNLIDTVNVATDEKLELGFAPSGEAALLFRDSGSPSWRAVVMPMRV